MLLPLQKGILYGPIDSRRLGKSLGINLMPSKYKLCSFNCVYCHYGLTDVLALDMKNYRKDVPTVEQVLDKVEEALRSTMEYDYITFSGNGEPTLHPDFNQIVKGVVDLRHKYRPHLKIALLSNSSRLYNEEVKKSISHIDVPVFKLDAGDATTFKKINRPAEDVDFRKIVTSLQPVKGIYIQTVLMAGEPSNVGEDTLETYFETIIHINPLEVQIYSLDRPVPYKDIRRVLPNELEKIARIGSKKTGVLFRAFYI